MEQLEAALNRFQITIDAGDGDTTTANSAQEAAVRDLSKCVNLIADGTDIPILTDTVVGLCTDVVEGGSPDSVALRAVTKLLANLSLREENKALILRFGVPSSYVLVLQQWRLLPPETTYYIFDFLSTVSSSNSYGRQLLRPSIPYVIALVRHYNTNLDVLFGGAVVLNSLAMLDHTNCELIAQRGGVQALVDAFRFAHKLLETVSKLKPQQSRNSTPNTLSKARQARMADQALLSKAVLKWCRSTLRIVCASPSEDIAAAFQATDFGIYGSCIALDELKWDLKFEVKRGSASKPIGGA